MNKFARHSIAALALSATIFSASSAFAADPIDMRTPESILLNETMSLYDVAGTTVTGPSGSALSPQAVTVIGLASSPNSDKYYIVETWMGAKAVQVTGKQVTPVYSDSMTGKTVEIQTVTPLYNAPSYDTNSGVSLAPQTVKVKSTNGGIYLEIDTWLGSKWIDKRDVR